MSSPPGVDLARVDALLFEPLIDTLEHATLGALEIFLVPIGPDSKGQRYQAIFN